MIILPLTDYHSDVIILPRGELQKYCFRSFVFVCNFVTMFVIMFVRSQHYWKTVSGIVMKLPQ